MDQVLHNAARAFQAAQASCGITSSRPTLCAASVPFWMAWQGVLPRGTTTVICDPHEIANVLGVAGIRYFLAAAEPLAPIVAATTPSDQTIGIL